MHRIVTGSFDNFAGAARGVSALMADGFGNGEISIVALPPPAVASARRVRRRTGALVAGALGAVIGPGSVFAWTPDPGDMLMWAPSLGALVGASLGTVIGLVLERLACRAAAMPTSPASAGEVVSVVVDAGRADRVESILRGQGATVGRRYRLASAPRVRPSIDRAPPPRLVPYRP